MKQRLVLLVTSLVIGALAIVLQQTGFDTIGFILGILALALFVWWLIQLTLVTRLITHEPRQVEPKHTFRRSVTAALHAAIFSASTEEEE
ncbi:MAG TPA: hypothetical protein VKR06_06750 [Ktedonosporobacter sp.]|nr:hypothetical protein [Ktedonosporobacter sp.]